jgi:hypothetical protein
MLNVDNLHAVKRQLSQYEQLFVAYQEAHITLYDSLTTDDDAQHGESKRYQDHENEIQTFRQNVLDWITGAERKLFTELDELSGLRSHKSSRHSRSSRISKAGSTKSALAHENAELAALMVQREQLFKQRELEGKMQALKAEQEELKLDLKIKTTFARSQVYTRELDAETHSQLNNESNTMYDQPCMSHNVTGTVVHTSEANHDNVTNVNNNVTDNTVVSMFEANHDNVTHIPTHVHASVIVSDPLSDHSVVSVNTMHHDFSLPGLHSHRKRQTLQPQNTHVPATPYVPYYFADYMDKQLPWIH